MKDPISNSSLQLSTLSKRLYFFTGKGGTGKTTLSLAFTKILKEHKKNVLYINLTNENNHTLLNQLQLNSKTLNNQEILTSYLERKFNNKSIAQWLVNSKFYISLFNIVPPLNDIIIWGHITDLLEKQEDLVIVLDAPSTGHALSFIESPFNFSKIFKVGVMFKDLNKIIKFIDEPKNIHFFIIELPQQLARSESSELENNLKKMLNFQYHRIINQCLHLTESLTEAQSLPDFLQTKMTQEIAITEERKHNQIKIPFYPDSPIKIIHSISEFLNGN